ncbi:hypothetical protein FOCC_FOCC013142 [Frankliniella occidentalis]|nr:hypothetical protein FOCC_FOCC013142 [Frankliniella occidentalis]
MDDRCKDCSKEGGILQICILCRGFVHLSCAVVKENKFKCFECLLKSGSEAENPAEGSGDDGGHSQQEHQGKSTRTVYPWEGESSAPIINFAPGGQKFTYKKCTINPQDWLSLSPSTYLNDSIIDIFLKIVTSDELIAKDASVKLASCLALENISMGLVGLFSRVKKDNWILSDIWIIPTHIRRIHWILLLVLIKQKKIVILNSMPSDTPSHEELEQLQITRYMLAISHLETFGAEISWADWTYQLPCDMDNQSNGFDCGICVCLWVWGLCTATTPPSPTQICGLSEKIRKWMRKFIFSKAEKAGVNPPAAPPLPVPAPHKDDLAWKMYADFDKKVASGELVIEKPWTTLQSPPVFTHGWEYKEIEKTKTRKVQRPLRLRKSLD